jgi:hypothetical protein
MVNFDLLIFLTEEVTTNWPSVIEINLGGYIIGVIVASTASILVQVFYFNEK